MHVEDCPFCKAEITGFEDGTVRIKHQASCYFVHFGCCDFQKHWICTPADLAVWNQRAYCLEAVKTSHNNASPKCGCGRKASNHFCDECLELYAQGTTHTSGE